MADELYVGYLPQAPPRLARFVRAVAIALVAVAVVLALVLANSQRPFEPGIFEFGTLRTFEGTLAEKPYPTLFVDRPNDGTSSYLLTSVGKHGAGALVAGLDGERVRLTGTLVHRDDRTMVEVVGSPEVLAETGVAAPAMASLGERTFVGEIVDSKCFLGVMKPGRWKPHRACAARCISGGAPPLLVVTEAGRTSYLLLTDAEGGAVNDRVLDFVAEPVEVTGELLRAGDVLVLRADSWRRHR